MGWVKISKVGADRVIHFIRGGPGCQNSAKYFLFSAKRLTAIFWGWKAENANSQCKELLSELTKRECRPHIWWLQNSNFVSHSRWSWVRPLFLKRWKYDDRGENWCRHKVVRQVQTRATQFFSPIQLEKKRYILFQTLNFNNFGCDRGNY